MLKTGTNFPLVPSHLKNFPGPRTINDGAAVNYYNEFDPKAAAWLRELIKQGHIPNGVVDERSITEIKPHELSRFTQCHFFAGISGWSLALKLAGWPDDRPIWTGSCPCQPFSSAGKGLAQEDSRHLWPAFFGLIRQCRPDFIVGEQVESAIGHGWLDGISTDLEGEGYAVGSAVLGAHSVGAPHIRQRLYWVAHPNIAERGTNGPRGYDAAGKDAIGNENYVQSGADNKAGGLANSASDGRQQRWAESNGGSVIGSRGVDRLGDSNLSGSDERARGRQQPVHHENSGAPDGLGVADGAGRNSREHAAETAGHGNSTEPAGAVFGLDHAIVTGLEGHSRDVANGDQSGRIDKDKTGSASATGGAWDDFDILHCTDGKARRVESGVQPLAHGVSHRVGKLRGYGNAIVPQVAAVFIEEAAQAIAADCRNLVVEDWS